MHLRNPELYACASNMIGTFLTAVKFLVWLLDWDAIDSHTYERRLGKAED